MESRLDNLNGRIALVTGSSRGIGRAIALALAKAGADVVINYKSRSREAHEVESQITGQGRRCVSIQADVSIASDVERLLQEAERQMGPIDILVNNAGISCQQAFEEITERDWDEMIDVNLKSYFLMTQAVLPGMRARKWGRIINISSGAAQVGGVVGPHYAASKAGILGLTRFYASRLVREGIRVNAIAPAVIETDMITANPNFKAALIPIGRFGTPDEVAEVAVMLAKNDYINGQTMNVNGGLFFT
jgi:3-oxoacyl-[acyl-carrier protein] reductase